MCLGIECMCVPQTAKKQNGEGKAVRNTGGTDASTLGGSGLGRLLWALAAWSQEQHPSAQSLSAGLT